MASRVSAKHAERADGSGDQNFVLGGFAGLACNFHAAMIEFGDSLFQAERSKFIAVGAKRIGLDNVRAGFQIGHVTPKNFLGARGIQFVHAALRPQAFVEQ